MTAQKINIAIAELIGWKRVPVPKSAPWGFQCPKGEFCFVHHLPNYYGDLNACAEIFDFAADEGCRVELRNGLDKTWECEFSKPATSSSPEQNVGFIRGENVELYYGCNESASGAVCEAFLRVKGKWV